MSFSSASSWKKQSSRLKSGNMNLINNESIYGENATFNYLECKLGVFNDISGSLSSITTISADAIYVNDAFVHDLYISNLGQRVSNDRWLNVDLSNQLYIIDLSSAGNYTAIGGHSLMKQKTAWGSTAFGYDALRNISARTDISFANTAIGTASMCGSDLSNGIIGNYNSALGFNALKNITAGIKNTAIGANALSTNTSGSFNTATGESSLNLNQTGVYNVGMGALALFTNTSGSYNAACGAVSMSMNITGGNNVACGHQSLAFNTSGSNNTGLGYKALFTNTDASCNTAVGSSSLYSNTIGISNVAVGMNALYSDVSGSYNTVVGSNSDVTNTKIDRNQILGYNNKSGFSDVNMIGANITATGTGRTFISNVRDSSDSLISKMVVYDPVTKEFTYDGSLFQKTAVDSSGITTIVIGDTSKNTVIGGSLTMNSSKPIFFTSSSTTNCIKQDSGTDSLAVTGYNGGYLNGTNGSASKTLIWDASANVGINTTPAYHLDVYDSSSANVIVSRFKSEANGGLTNTFINVEKGNGYGGVYGGFLNQGINAGAVIYGLNGGSRSNNNVVVSNTNIVLDASYVGSLGVQVRNLGTGTGTVYFSAGGYLTNTAPSDSSLKKNIVSLIDADVYNKMARLNPVQYEWIDPANAGGIKYGFLANEIQTLFPALVSTFKDASGNDKLGYDPVSLIPILTTGILKNVDEISRQRVEIDELKKENASLKSILSSIQERLSALEMSSNV